MPADPRIYDSARLARRYASTRPPVHQAICRRVLSAWLDGHRQRAALDVGCGAGVSTAALLPYAHSVTGVDPFDVMLTEARRAVPDAVFLRGTADALPLPSASVDLVTAAGSLNYANVDSAMAEIARVVSPGGHLVAYDFSTGRPWPRDTLSDAAFDAFVACFPWPPGYALDLSALPYATHEFHQEAFETFTVDLLMTGDEYLDYLLGETNVEAAVRGGASEASIRDACRDLFHASFAGETRRVAFDCVVAVARHGA